MLVAISVAASRADSLQNYNVAFSGVKGSGLPHHMSKTHAPFDVWVVVSAIISFLDLLFGVGQFEGQSLAPQLQLST